jgi:dolichol kinase
MEGSLAMFISQILAAELIFGYCSLNAGLIAAALISALAEAHLHCCDNLIIPICSMLVFWIFE